MNTNTDLSTVKLWFERAVPNPTDKNRAVQLGCHFEEFGEMLDALASRHPILRDDMRDISSVYKTHFEVPIDAPYRKELLDALCDQIVTAVGVAHMFGLDIGGALNEVNRSNWSKMVDGHPVFDANGKIAKGVNYTPPNLEPYV